MKIAIIGHRKVENENLVKLKFTKFAESWLDKDVEFLFGNNSQFDDICYDVVSQFENSFLTTQFYCKSPDKFRKFDKYVLPKSCKNAGRLIYINRNKAMIDACDMVIFYFNENYKPENSNSGTRIAYEYAKRKDKKFINLF